MAKSSAKYTRNIGAKKYSSVEEIYDSVNNDPKRPGYQVVYLDQAIGNGGDHEWERHLWRNGFGIDDITIKYPKIGDVTYTALIIEATPEEVLALKICF